MAIIGAGVTLQGIIPQAFAWAWNVSGAVTFANVGELVTQDITAANTVKLLGDGDAPIGYLATFEDRTIEGIKVGTVDHKGGFPIKYTGALAVGDSVVGSALAGLVKKAGAANRTLVTEIVDASNAVVLFI
jgi:hypothetical protein